MQPPPPPPSRSQFHAPKNRFGPPPVPVKPAHLLRNSFTPPPHTGNSSQLLGLSSSSLPDAEFSGLDHKLSSTLKLLQPFPVQRQELFQPPKPPKPPIRKDSMRKSLEETPHLFRKQETVTSLEESFFTRFKPQSNLPDPPIFTTCLKTYPSMDDATLPRKHRCSKSTAPISLTRADCFSIKAEVSPNDCFAWHTSPSKIQAPIQKPITEPPSPPLTANGPQYSSISKLPSIYKTSVSMAIPPPPPLPVEQTRKPAYSVSALSPPPPLPLIPPPRTHNSPVQPISPLHQANTLCTSGSFSTQESPISVQILARSVFAKNLAKLYSSGQMESKKDPNAFSTNLKPLSPPKPGIKPALGRRPQLRSVEETHSQPVVLQNKSESPLNKLPRSSSSASLVSFNYSLLEVSRTRSSSSLGPVVIKQSSISRNAPPPPTFKTSSVSTTSSGLNLKLNYLKIVRSQSMRTAPLPSQHAPTCSTQIFDRSLSLSSSAPLKISESNMKTDAVQNELSSNSFRAAPPPPPLTSLEETPHLSRKQETVTSLQESFFTRFKPQSTLPDPPLFTNCLKTYPSMDDATLPRKHGCSKSTAPIPLPRAECVSIKAEVSPNDCFARDTSPPKIQAPIQKPITERPSPPLIANGPQFSSISKLPSICKTSVSMAIPKPLSPLKPGIKPALVRRPQLRSVEEIHSQPVVLQNKSESSLTNLPRSISSASLVSFNYSSLEVSRTRSSSSLGPVVIKKSSISRKAPPPPTFRTSSVSTTSSGLNQPEILKVVRSQSMRTAPLSPRHTPTCSTQIFDRSLSQSSSAPLKTSESNMKTDAVPNEPSSDSFSFRAAPPPPPLTAPAAS